MEKPQIIIEYEENVEQLKYRAAQEGRDFNFENEVKLHLEKWILSIRSGKAPAPKIKRTAGISSFGRPFQVSRPYDIPQLEYALEYLKFVQANNNKQEDSLINGTTRQSTLAIHYMRKALKFPRTTGNDTEDAVFIKFLIGKDFDGIRKLLGDPLKRPVEKTGKATEILIKDLTTVLKQFEKIQFFEGAKLIEADIDKLQNDLKTFNPD